MAWIAYMIASGAFIFSIGTPYRNPTTGLTTFAWDNKTRYAFLYHLFGFLWVNAFIIGCA